MTQLVQEFQYTDGTALRGGAYAMNATDEQSPAQIGQFLTSSRHDDGTQEAIDLNTFQLQP